LNGIIINKNLKLLLINYLARKVDVLFHFPSRSQYTRDILYCRTVFVCMCVFVCVCVYMFIILPANVDLSRYVK